MQNGLRLAAMATICVTLAVSCRALSTAETPQNPAMRTYDADFGDQINAYSDSLIDARREVFRRNTFGSEDFWGGQLRLHEAILGERYGGVGPGLTARQALALGLKVDVDQLPRIVAAAITGGSVSLDSETTTLELLKAGAVVGVEGFFNDPADPMRLTSVGITCALCHSTVNDQLTTGIGDRVDGWPNRDLDVGRIIALAPSLQPFEEALRMDSASIRKVLLAWGPGKYDAELIHDGKGFRPDGK